MAKCPFSQDRKSKLLEYSNGLIEKREDPQCCKRTSISLRTRKFLGTPNIVLLI